MKENLRPSSFRLLSHKSIKSIANYRKSIKINNHKNTNDRFVSISNINRSIIDYDRLCLISIEYQKYRLDTPCTRRWRSSKATKQTRTRRCIDHHMLQDAARRRRCRNATSWLQVPDTTVCQTKLNYLFDRLD